MFATFSALVTGRPAFPYNLEEPSESSFGCWNLYQGTSREDTSPVSVFKCLANDEKKLAAARNGVKRLRGLRHPNILVFKDSHELQEKGVTVIYLVTEPVKPLIKTLNELTLEDSSRSEYLAMGLLQVSKAISFLNNDCSLIHGNICQAAVMVTETLDWKLFGFDLLSEASLPGDFDLAHHSWLVASQYKAAELAKSEWPTIQQAPSWAVDAWGLGCLMQEVFSGQPLQKLEDLRKTDAIPPALLQDYYQKLLSSTPSRRLNPSKVTESKFLNNKLVDLVAFMESIALKDAVDKEAFFKRLPAQLPSIPTSVRVRKILPLLAAALQFGGAPAVAVNSLLLIGKSLQPEEFNRRVVPCISKLFASTDRALRRSLLESLGDYAQNLNTTVIEEQIYPSLSTGFSDANAFIRELTLKSILPLAPKLTARTLQQNVLKQLSKLQVDPEPSIRANTTVLLGNIAQYLGDATCKKVLLNAFSRALKDDFPPARIGGLRAIVATAKYHSAEDAALRIVPAAAPMAVDPVSDVRSAALQCLDLFVRTLHEHDAKVARELAAAGEAPAQGSAGQAAPAIGAGSVLTWAVSSLMSGGAKTSPAAPAPPRAAGATSPTAPAASTSSASGPVGGAKSATTGRVPLSTASVQPSAASSSTAGDGWDAGGGADGWDDMEAAPDEAEMEARARLARLAGGRQTAAAAAAAVPSSSSSPRDTDGWQAEEDPEVWADMDTQPAAITTARPQPAQSTAGAGGTGAAPRPRPVRPPREVGASGASKPKLGAMKLGATKAGKEPDAEW